MFLKRLTSVFVLIFLCCTTCVATGYKDQRFIRNEAVKASLTKHWTEQELCPELTFSCDRAIWGAIVDAKNKNVREVNVWVPNVDRRNLFCGNSMLTVVPVQPISISDFIRQFCYDSTFDESKFKIKFVGYSFCLRRVFPPMYSEFQNLSEETPNRALVENPDYYSYLRYFEIIPGEKALVQVREK
jgi:hypothetical protein